MCFFSSYICFGCACTQGSAGLFHVTISSAASLKYDHMRVPVLGEFPSEFVLVKWKQLSAAVRKQPSHRLFILGCDKLWPPVGHKNVDTHIYATSKYCSHKNNTLSWQETASVVALLRWLFSCRWHICSGCGSKRRTSSPAVPSVSQNTVFLTASLW